MKAAKQSLQSKKCLPDKDWKKRKNEKKWFDSDAQKARDAGKQKHKNPQDNLLRSKYHEKLQQFKGANPEGTISGKKRY